MNYFKRHIWGIFAEPQNKVSTILKILPFIIVIIAYSGLSLKETNLDENQKIYPSYSKMVDKVGEYLFSPDRRISDKEDYKTSKKLEKTIAGLEKEIEGMEEQGQSASSKKFELFKIKMENYYLGFKNSKMLDDTTASLYRLAYAMVISSLIALVFSLYMGMYKIVDHTFNNFMTVYSLIQPVAILPIIMIVFGVEDYGKIIFMCLGVIPPMLLGSYLNVKNVPKQTIVKAKTLGASEFQIIRKVVLPQILPNFINIIRLTLFLGWMLLLSAEMISAESGLGYRIMLEKRFTNMDIIIPYVLWIMLISFATDKLLQKMSEKFFPWNNK